MNQHQHMEARLWEYIDGLTTPDEHQFIEQLIHTNAEWRSKYHELLDFNKSLAESIDLEEPSMRFTRDVMEAIATQHIAPAAKSYINKKIIFGIGGFMLSMIIGLLVYAFAQVNWSAGNTRSGGFDFSRVDWSGLLNNNYINAFMIINVVLGLMLVDQYLSMKKKNWQDSAS